MSQTAVTSPTAPSLSRADLIKDLSALLSLPAQTSAQISNLLSSNLPRPPPGPTTSAPELLSSFSPATGDIDGGVALSAAYTKDMRAVQRQGLEERLEKAGEGIEGVRERAEGAQAALGAVKL